MPRVLLREPRPGSGHGLSPSSRHRPPHSGRTPRVSSFPLFARTHHAIGCPRPVLARPASRLTPPGNYPIIMPRNGVAMGATHGEGWMRVQEALRRHGLPSAGTPAGSDRRFPDGAEFRDRDPERRGSQGAGGRPRTGGWLRPDREPSLTGQRRNAARGGASSEKWPPSEPRQGSRCASSPVRKPDTMSAPSADRPTGAASSHR